MCHREDTLFFKSLSRFLSVWGGHRLDTLFTFTCFLELRVREIIFNSILSYHQVKYVMFSKSNLRKNTAAKTSSFCPGRPPGWLSFPTRELLKRRSTLLLFL